MTDGQRGMLFVHFPVLDRKKGGVAGVNIHWYPGHMAKTRRLIDQSLKLVDGIIHLADARLPQSSQNPLLYELAGNKPTMLVLAKADLAAPQVSRAWTKGGDAIAVSLRSNKDRQNLLNFVHTYLDSNLTKRYPRPWRVMVVGIPNVGKSTLINLLAQRRSAKVGDKPGITLTQQWIKVSPKLEMLDMPGILWPKIDDRLTGLKLAASGCIKDEILPMADVAVWLLKFLGTHYPQALTERYGSAQPTLEVVAQNKGLVVKGGGPNLEKAAEMVVRDFRSGRLGRITLDLGGV